MFSYEIGATAGETITITVVGINGFDPRVTLNDSKGRTLAENDDHGTGDSTIGRFDSRIADFTFAAGGSFTIVISGYDNTGGDFTLEIVRGGEQPVIDDGTDFQTLQETVNPNEAYAYELNAEAVMCTPSARSLDDALDTIIAIYDQADNLMAYNDDHGDPSEDLARVDSRVTRLIVAGTGRYFVEVSGYHGGGGEFDDPRTDRPECADERAG
ncbi:MAG: DVUA0089 family protein [Chloroflexi bacterium]|uniref:DVUA0089 family protein n=1 Tax=Candidatus Flexifilum breve TaxID=3140694 RepID=UPI0031363042|nr:DVUA0089 family protein [Chloroflexota bacterium]